MNQKLLLNGLLSAHESHKRLEHEELGLFTWGYSVTGNIRAIPSRCNDFDTKFDLKTYQQLHDVTIIFDYNGEIHSYGSGKCGQLGHGNTLNLEYPMRIEALAQESIIEISESSSEFAHTLFLNKVGKVFGCGSNESYQAIGVQTADGSKNVMIPQRILCSEDISSIQCGSRFSGAVNKARNKIFSFGRNISGCLGIGSTYYKVHNSGLREVVGLIQKEWKVDSVCFRVAHCLALTTSLQGSQGQNRVWAWGNNTSCQHGNDWPDGQDYTEASPVKYFDESDVAVKKIASGGHHCAALSQDGDLYVWGSNRGRGGLSESNMTILTLPTKINFMFAIVASGDQKSVNIGVLDICVSRAHNLAVCNVFEKGRLRKVCYSWGKNGGGQCGLGNKGDDIHRPKEILFFSRIEEDWSIVKIGVGHNTSYCVVEKSYSHLDDEELQGDKLELLKEYEMIP